MPEQAPDPFSVPSAPDTRDLNIRDDGLTIGQWETEKDSCDALDKALIEIGLWRTYSEVSGTLLQPKPAQSSIKVRIDRILVPTPALLEMGWQHGAIGIEAKRSGTKIGPVIAQSIDYGRAVWKIPTNQIRIVLDWVFIWPMAPQHGTVASILAQQRIGSASSTRWNQLLLNVAGTNIIRVDRYGDVSIGPGNSGTRVGSR